MIGIPDTVQLENLHRDRYEAAQIVKLERNLARDRIDKVWWYEPWVTREHRKKARLEYPDYQWWWRKIVGKYQNKWLVQRLAVVTDDGNVQGAIVFDPDYESYLNPGISTVYVEYLASAPRNRRKLADDPLYRGTGSALLLIAMYYSRKAGLGGRLTLCPLPNVVDWYVERHGFRDTGVSAGRSNFLELPPEGAEYALQELSERILR
jgi:hypothetical protein